MAGDTGDERSAYCLGCLGTVSPNSERCPHCRFPFTGAGIHQRISGSPPREATDLLLPSHMRAAVAA
jgi:hypothetical protein